MAHSGLEKREWPRTEDGDVPLHCAVAWSGLLIQDSERKVFRAVVRVGGPRSRSEELSMGGVVPKTILEEGGLDAMGELRWKHADSWCWPVSDVEVLVEMLIDANGQRPEWDTRKFAYTRLYPLVEGAPGIAKPL